MKFLVLQAYLELIAFEVHLVRSDFRGLHDRVRRSPLGKRAAHAETAERISAAVDLACIWYWKPVFCLQRSAATTRLLRRHGIPAKMVVGVKQAPIRAHAWVEVDGVVVNDKPYVREIFVELETC